MKMKKIWTFLILISLLAICRERAQAAEQELIPVHITGYCLRGLTKSETPARHGICAFRPEDIGKTAVVYDGELRLIGIYEIEDTGGENVRAGYVLDVWCESKEECYQLTQDGFVQILDAEG